MNSRDGKEIYLKVQESLQLDPPTLFIDARCNTFTDEFIEADRLRYVSVDNAELMTTYLVSQYTQPQGRITPDHAEKSIIQPFRHRSDRTGIHICAGRGYSLLFSNLDNFTLRFRVSYLRQGHIGRRDGTRTRRCHASGPHLVSSWQRVHSPPALDCQVDKGVVLADRSISIASTQFLHVSRQHTCTRMSSPVGP
jgi:hypothetical protein